MGNLKLNQDGTLDISSVDGLSRTEIEDWVRHRLKGEDYLVASDVKQSEPPYYLFAFIYPRLNRDSRSYMRTAVEQLLGEMAHGDSAWRGKAGHSLLLLAQRLGEREFIEPVRKMAEQSFFFDQATGIDGDELHHRLLQTLVALRWRGSRQFWLAEFFRRPSTFAPVVFAGLALSSAREAIQLLPRVEWDDANLTRRMRVALRGLLPGHNPEDIAKYISEVLPRLRPFERPLVESTLPELRDLLRSASRPSYVEDEGRGDLVRELGAIMTGNQSASFGPAHIADRLWEPGRSVYLQGTSIGQTAGGRRNKSLLDSFKRDSFDSLLAEPALLQQQ